MASCLDVSRAVGKALWQVSAALDVGFICLAFLKPVTAEAAKWSPVNARLVGIPAPSTTDLHAERFGTRAWQVAFDHNRLVIAPAEKNKPIVPFPPAIETAHLGYRGSQPTQAVHVGNDWFLAYYFGEFGGGLWQFDSTGTVGRRLLDDPTYGVLRYGDEILAETQDNSMMVRDVRIHRFARRSGQWEEVGHADFPRNITSLTRIGSDLYAMTDDHGSIALAKIDLTGHVTMLWHCSSDLRVSDIVRLPNGDFALGATGYIVRLFRANGSFAAQWYAPRDCVTYSNVSEDDGSQARCVGNGVPGYERRALVPVRNPLVSLNGNWLLSRYPPIQLLHFSGSAWLPAALPPFSKNEYPYQIDQTGSYLVLRTTQHVWLRENNRWRSVRADGGCPTVVAIASSSVWGIECSDTPKLWRASFDGTARSWLSSHGVPEIIAAGLFDDAWFSEKDVSFLGHIDASGGMTETRTTSPISSLSRGGDKIWFTETDKTHYGFVDAQDQVHEFKEPSQYIDVLGVSGTPQGAWMRDSLVSRMMLYHMDGPSHFNNYIADIRLAAISPDGSAWALDSNWLTVVHATENAEMTRYRLACLDAHVQFFPAPGDGIWVQALEPHCNALIDAKGLHKRDLPLIEQVDYE